MPLKLAGNFVVDAPRDQVWILLFDVNVMKEIANKIPGIHVDALTQISDDQYEGNASVGVAMVKGKYAGTVSVIEKRAREFVKLRADGKGGANWMNGEIALTLADQNGKTLMTYAGTGNVGGTLASLGQRLIDTVGKQIIAQGTKAFAEELAARVKKN